MIARFYQWARRKERTFAGQPMSDRISGAIGRARIERACMASSFI
jgi:hypothetical protein